MSKWPSYVRDAPVRDAVALARAITGEGLDVDAVTELQAIGFTSEELATLVINPRTLRHRRSRGEPLSPDEADRVVRLARTFEHAVEVLGDRGRAWLWLRAANRALDGHVPVQLLRTETGARLVEETLLRIEHGIVA